jgi:hypothetical protein
MAKLYDIVETSKMAMEYDGSLINVEYRANGALENGRLVAIENGKVRYAKSTDTKVYLHCSVEKMYEEFRGLTEFRKEDGQFVRIAGFRIGDEFKTTAVSGTLAKGDKVVIDDTDSAGKYKKAGTLAGTENFVAEVVELGKLGFDSYSFNVLNSAPAYVLRVIKG